MSDIEVRHLSKSFDLKGVKVEALKDINLSIKPGDIYGIIGMSGAGKSTLVRCMNFLEVPTEGQVLIDGKALGDLTEKELRKQREEIGMIFQHFNLHHLVHPVVLAFSACTVICHKIIIFIVPSKRPRAYLIGLPATPQFLLTVSIPLEILKRNLLISVDGIVDVVHRVIDTFVHVLNTVCHMDISRKFLCLVLTRQPFDLLDQCFTFLAGNELRTLNGIHKQLQFRKFKLPARQIILRPVQYKHNVHLL